MISPEAEALWQYSLRLYSEPLVRTACLRLQEEAGADVNLIFLLLFAGMRGLQLARSDVAVLERECEGWRETVIKPLRRVRRLIKDDELRLECDVYQRVKTAELLAERRHQITLATLLERMVESAHSCAPENGARLNLQAYILLQNAPSDAVAALLNAYSHELACSSK